MPVCDICRSTKNSNGWIRACDRATGYTGMNYDNIFKMLKHRIFPVLLLALLLLITGCDSVSDTLTHSTQPQQTLQSSDNLKRNCEFRIVESMDDLEDEGLKTGTAAIDFTLRDTNGNEVTLSDLLLEKPVVMVLGSFT